MTSRASEWRSTEPECNAHTLRTTALGAAPKSAAHLAKEGSGCWACPASASQWQVLLAALPSSELIPVTLNTEKRINFNMKYNLRSLSDTQQHCLWKPESALRNRNSRSRTCVSGWRLPSSPRQWLFLQRELWAMGDKHLNQRWRTTHKIKERKEKILPSYHELSSHE